MEANYVHKDSTTLVQDELVKNELNQIELQYNALKQQKFNELLKENQELKKQLEESDRKLFLTKHELDMREKTIDNKLNQQKEFIKYLEEKEKQFNMAGDPINSGACCGILKKYKSIIGVSDEKEN